MRLILVFGTKLLNPLAVKKNSVMIWSCVLMLMLYCTPVCAQPTICDQPVLLIPSSGRIWLNPVWSPDGRYLAFSSEKYKGLWVATSDGSRKWKVSDRDGVGFGFSWSADSKTILARPSEYRNFHKTQWVELIQAETGTSRVMTVSEGQIQGLPQWANGDKHLAVINNGKIQWMESGKEPNETPVEKAEISVIFPVEGKLLKASLAKSETEVLADFGSNIIFNLACSPDSKNFAFQVAGRGLFVIKSDGSGLKNLGWGERPCWTPDGKYLVVMLTKDDGHQILQSDLYALDPETGQEFLLTGHTSVIALSPAVSPDGKKIAFENPKTGGIYYFKLK